MKIEEALAIIHKSCEEYLADKGFQAVYPKGIKPPAIPLQEEEGNAFLLYESKGGSVKIQWEKVAESVSLLVAEVPVKAEGEAEKQDKEFTPISLWQFHEANSEERDAKSIANDFRETLEDTFGKSGTAGAVKVKMPHAVSRAQARSGASDYDAKTLATRFATIFPELKDIVKENISTYGDFLPDEFFRNHAVEPTLNLLREKNDTTLKKLFNSFNEIYDDGTYEVQGIICVTILGEMQNDPELLATAQKYMSQALSKSVVNVNAYLQGRSGNRWRQKLMNPPKYKPKKK